MENNRDILQLPIFNVCTSLIRDSSHGGRLQVIIIFPGPTRLQPLSRPRLPPTCATRRETSACPSGTIAFILSIIDIYGVCRLCLDHTNNPSPRDGELCSMIGCPEGSLSNFSLDLCSPRVPDCGRLKKKLSTP